MSDFDYQSITSALQRLEIAADAAECHGAMSSVICLTGEAGLQPWLSAHFPEIEHAIAEGNALAGETRQLIAELYQQVLQQLQRGQFDYELLMPEDTESLAMRTEALANWCQGFLLGLRCSGVSDISKFNGDLAEILEDITEISQVSGGGLEDTEEEERSWTELVEYLRVGVMLFCETLQAPNRTGQTSTVH